MGLIKRDYRDDAGLITRTRRLQEGNNVTGKKIWLHYVSKEATSVQGRDWQLDVSLITSDRR